MTSALHIRATGFGGQAARRSALLADTVGPYRSAAGFRRDVIRKDARGRNPNERVKRDD